MLFIQQLSVLSLLISSAFAAVIPQDKATKAANLKRVIADRQYKRSSIGKRTTLPAPQVSQAYCAGYRNLAGICVEKCDFSLANVIQKQSGGCQCTDGFEQIGLSCLAICLPNFTRNLSTNQCGCNTNTFDLLSSGACVAKCSTSQDRVNGSCQPKCIGNVIRGPSGACDSCQNSSTSFLSQVFSATTGLVTSANCVNKCSLPFPLYAQNPSGGCLGTVGAPCKGNGVTCQNGLSCGFLSGVCALGI